MFKNKRYSTLKQILREIFVLLFKCIKLLFICGGVASLILLLIYFTLNKYQIKTNRS